jgi:hypothetical protein
LFVASIQKMQRNLLIQDLRHKGDNHHQPISQTGDTDLIRQRENTHDKCLLTLR